MAGCEDAILEADVECMYVNINCIEELSCLFGRFAIFGINTSVCLPRLLLLMA